MKIKIGDKILVIAGKDKGKTGNVSKVIKKHNRVVVGSINMRTKHIKKTQQRAGEKITYEAPIDASNVMILDPKENKPVRIGYKRLDSGKKERISRLSGASLDGLAKGSTKKPAKKSGKAEEKEEKPTKSKKRTIKA